MLPSPGFSVVYPPNMKSEYDSFLASDGVNQEDFKKRGLSGDYRPIVCKPKDVSWEVLHYSNREAELVKTDRDLLFNKGKRIEGGRDNGNEEGGL